MRLKRMDLHGFKSFPDKVSIVFDEGITAIVGPNGSGKSNIADAIRWVLGEQSARQLRGSKMEDVIFAGTQKRRRVSFCEVALIFENEDHGLNIDFSEVSVSRRMYRDGKSEYYLNGILCRLKDVVDLFRDTGIGKEGYSIIGQGKIDELLSNKPEERRAVFEEASGVSKFKADRTDALRKLERTEGNLIRIDDIIGELSAQIEPLSDQRQTAIKYLALRDELKYNEVNLFVHQAIKYQERIKAQTELITDLDALLKQDETARDEIDESIQKLYEESESHERESLGIREENILYTSSQQELKGKISLAGEKKNNYEREIERLLTENHSREERILSLNEQIHALLSDTSASKTLFADKESEISAYEDELSQLEQVILSDEKALENAKNAVIERLNKQSDINARKARLSAMRVSVEERILAQEKLLSEMKASLDSETNEICHEEETVSSLKEKSEQFKADKRKIEENQSAITVSIQNKNHEIQQNQEKIAQVNTRIKLLNQMKHDYEGFQGSVRKLLSDADKNAELKNCISCVVADIIQADSRYERAIEVALGSSLQNIITETEEDAQVLIRHLRSNNYGRATFLPLSSIAPRLLNEEERQIIRMPGCIGIASELVADKPKYNSIIQYLLGRTVIVSSFNAGVSIARKSNSAFRIVTLDGDLLNTGGSITGGSLQHRSTSILARDRILEEETNSLKALIKHNDELENGLQTLQKELQQILFELADINDRIYASSIDESQHLERLSIMNETLSMNTEKYNSASTELSSLQETLSDIDAESQGIEQLSGPSNQNTMSDEDIAAMQSMLFSRREQASSLRSMIDSLRSGLTTERARHLSNESKKDLLSSEVSRLQSEIDANLTLIQNTETLRDDVMSSTDALTRELESLNAKTVESTALLHKTDEIRARISSSIQESVKQKGDIQNTIDQHTAQLHKAEMTKARLENEMTSLHDRIWNDYELTYASAVPLSDENFQVNGAVSRISGLKYEMHNLGEVNIGSIDQFKSISERLESMTSERDDLNRAKEELEEVIRRFEDEITRRFKSQFELINQNFKIVFAELFNGGTADLILTDPSNLLETGIDIVAQPPGKKLQSLTLLSGGERTLTAIAILFAMLRTKKTPFCVLDEIEAALDEANSDMYAEYLKSYSSHTQFVIITHKKESMEVADSMYGITMQEKGISTVVSVKLTDSIG